CCLPRHSGGGGCIPGFCWSRSSRRQHSWCITLRRSISWFSGMEVPLRLGRSRDLYRRKQNSRVFAQFFLGQCPLRSFPIVYTKRVARGVSKVALGNKLSATNS